MTESIEFRIVSNVSVVCAQVAQICISSMTSQAHWASIVLKIQCVFCIILNCQRVKGDLSEATADH